MATRIVAVQVELETDAEIDEVQERVVRVLAEFGEHVSAVTYEGRVVERQDEAR